MKIHMNLQLFAQPANHTGATGMSADPYILTERIARILDGQVLRALTLFSEKPTAAPGRA